jgi:phosphoribosylglycinamide formyltransferase-1
MQPRIVILISGRGSNMAAILAAGLPLEVAAVVSNVPHAGGLELAAAQGIPTEVVDHRAYTDRAAFDVALMAAIDRHAPQLVVLAGFMRIFSPQFVAHYQGRLINIHPSLLPAFPGLHTHRQALAAGVRIHGCTVHFVTDELDHGPIVAQAAVPVLAEDTEALLGARVLRCEHELYPRVLRWWAEGRLEPLEGGRIRVQGVTSRGSGSLIIPEEA